ncbi:DNA cytosine methyltransferase [Mammaliicoccus sp. G-M28]|uniref:DNA cytosine methyltransferase n=1 Tax=Mammaliicoccus sp. G-M28 TaxID=2898688 RepID=UPI001EFC2136|nr:DNA cytosine methyltransferase [Mammaliicoccus sp. G-M28]
MNEYKIMDLFCGAGGLSKGFEEAGFKIELAIDMWEDAIKTYNYNHKNNVAKCMNIHELTNEYLDEVSNEITGIIGGPPCQGYSTVGTRDVDDPRNHLYKEYYRVVKKVRPKFFVIENVKGLLTLNKGSFKDDIIKHFTELGYNVEYKLLNASDYGVPQNRNRVFFVGIKEEAFKFPLPLSHKITTEEALSDLPSLDIIDLFSGLYRFEPQNEYQNYMRVKSKTVNNHEPTKHAEKTIEIISMIPDGGKITDLSKEYWEIRKYNKAFQRMNSKLPSNTIDTGHRNYFHYKENRVPSVRESARLQSFTDDFIFLGSKTSQYKQVGNAVPPLLAYYVANEIKKFLK